MRTDEEILSAIYESESREDLQLSITLNPDLVIIEKAMHEAQLEPFRAINPVHPEKVMENLERLIKACENFLKIQLNDIPTLTTNGLLIHQTLSAMKEGAE